MRIARGDELRFAELPGRRSADPFEGEDGSGLSVRVVHVPSGSGRTPHRHPASAEAIFVARGRGHVWRDGERREVRAGDLVLVPTGLAHATIPEDGTDMDLVCFFPVPSLAGNVEELLDVRIDPEGDGDEIASETGR